MKKLFFLLVMMNFLIFDQAFASVEKDILAETDFNKTFVGTINNKINVVFSLKNTNGKITGFYYYDQIGVEINLTGTINNGNVVLYELDYQNIKKAKIIAQFLGNTFSGMWFDLSTKRSFPIQLKEINKSIPSLPKTLIGTYKSDSETPCVLTMKISKSKGEYYYHFKSTIRTLTGKVTFSRSLEENLLYISFNGIEWEDYSAEVGPDDEPKETKYLPTVVDGLLSDNQIVIQNYGNSMNAYTKLAECGDVKYIYLKK